MSIALNKAGIEQLMRNGSAKYDAPPKPKEQPKEVDSGLSAALDKVASALATSHGVQRELMVRQLAATHAVAKAIANALKKPDAVTPEKKPSRHIMKVLSRDRLGRIDEVEIRTK